MSGRSVEHKSKDILNMAPCGCGLVLSDSVSFDPSTDLSKQDPRSHFPLASLVYRGNDGH